MPSVIFLNTSRNSQVTVEQTSNAMTTSKSKFETVGNDANSPTTVKKMQQLKNQHRPQDEVETDIETPLSSPERETASTSSTGTATPITSTCTGNGNNNNNKGSSSHDRAQADESQLKSRLKTNSNVGQGDEKGTSAQLLHVTTSRSSDFGEELEDEDYSNWPLRDIKDPHSNDVLYGRGGG